MDRRTFIGNVAGGLLAAPLAARAQKPAMPVIGFLHPGSSEPNGEYLQAFRKGLGESGFAEGQNVLIEFRWAEGQYDRLPALAADLVRRQVAVIAAGGGPVAALAAKAATMTIPIVFVSGDDPVRHGLVASLSRPGGNITGAVFFSVGLVAKRLELLRELLPAIPLITLLSDSNSPETEPEIRDFRVAASGLKQQINFISVGNARDIEAIFARLDRTAAIVMGSGPFFNNVRNQLVELAAARAIPMVCNARSFVTAGALASYGNSIPDAYRQMGAYAGRILKGAKPADLPVVQSTRFELVINLKTAKRLGITVPGTLLARADEVIQ